ncbi:hypothetical protein ACQPXT_34225 [Streptomyces sp. CA-100214]
MKSRRLVPDFETLPVSSEAFIGFSQAMLIDRHMVRPASRSDSERPRWTAAA